VRQSELQAPALLRLRFLTTKEAAIPEDRLMKTGGNVRKFRMGWIDKQVSIEAG
jgi:hypothetical protein